MISAGLHLIIIIIIVQSDHLLSYRRPDRGIFTPLPLKKEKRVSTA